MPKSQFLDLHIDYTKRVYGLDLLRSIAIMLVVIEHSSIVVLSAVFPSTTNLFSTFGFWGVELFFVLSGFLVGSILIRSFDRGKLTLVTILNFWKRRWYRTIPNYYLFLIINIIFAWLILEKSDLTHFKYAFFIQNFYGPHPVFFGEAWTLAVEEWFYLLTPIVFVLSCIVFNGKQKALLYAIIFIIIISALLRFNQYIHHPETDLYTWDILFRKIVMLRLDSIMFGVLGAYVMYYHQSFLKNAKNILFLIGAIFLCINYIISKYVVAQGNIGPFSKTLFFSCCSFSLLLLIPFCYYTNKPWPSFYTIITWISVLSYSMYLIHYSFLLNSVMILFPRRTMWEVIGMYCGYWFMLLLFAFIVYKYFEKPTMDLREAR